MTTIMMLCAMLVGEFGVATECVSVDVGYVGVTHGGVTCGASLLVVTAEHRALGRVDEGPEIVASLNVAGDEEGLSEGVPLSEGNRVQTDDGESFCVASVVRAKVSR